MSSEVLTLVSTVQKSSEARKHVAACQAVKAVVVARVVAGKAFINVGVATEGTVKP